MNSKKRSTSGFERGNISPCFYCNIFIAPSWKVSYVDIPKPECVSFIQQQEEKFLNIIVFDNLSNRILFIHIVGIISCDMI